MSISAERFVESCFEPDPNSPEEDTYILRFPHAGELVQGREFWKKHLADLLDAYLESLRHLSL